MGAHPQRQYEPSTNLVAVLQPRVELFYSLHPRRYPPPIDGKARGLKANASTDKTLHGGGRELKEEDRSARLAAPTVNLAKRKISLNYTCAFLIR